MGKKYGKSGLEEKSEDYWEDVRERHSGQEALDIVQDRDALKRWHKKMFGHNGWNL